MEDLEQARPRGEYEPGRGPRRRADVERAERAPRAPGFQEDEPRPPAAEDVERATEGAGGYEADVARLEPLGEPRGEQATPARNRHARGTPEPAGEAPTRSLREAGELRGKVRGKGRRAAGRRRRRRSS